MKSHAYKPTPEDVAWARNLVSILKDGGTWVCSWGTYRLNKVSRQVELLLTYPWFPEERLSELFHMTERTFEEVGYTVTGQKGG